VNFSGLITDVLHDVDFATTRPAGGRVVIPQQPESRPHPLPFRDLNTSFETSVFLLEFPFRLQARRGVLTRNTIEAGERFMAGRDHKIAVFLMNIFRSCGVLFEFSVAKAISADYDFPLCRVRRRTVGAIELVAPSQSPVL
jgi:hypothetical protein